MEDEAIYINLDTGKPHLQPAGKCSAPGEGWGMEEEAIYTHVDTREASLQPPGKRPDTPAAPPGKSTNTLCSLLVVLSLALGASLVAVTVLYFQGQKNLRDVKEAAHKIRVSLQPNSTVDTSKELAALQLLGEAQAGVRMLRAELGNVSAENRELQTRLDNITAALRAAPDSFRDVWTKLFTGWRSHGGNLYYFSQEEKSWFEAKQFCVSQGSHLTSVSSQGEQEFLSKGTDGQSYWIGLTDQGTEGRWRWVDGSEYRADASRGFWIPDQPDNWHQGIGGSEDCAQSCTEDQTLWNDVNCSLPARWICKQALGQAGL
ncbi:C-type lectin domain family 4 member K-like isoform X1 [Pelodiscus sinensis]|uniref:C-type lectin domain family 4 member K-like isoform X1 n=1 Tax=Pelodiscus sinensis TaxID=13735 RepID=UPI003F6B0EAF